MYTMFIHIGMYRKIVSYALLRSGLGSPTEIAVVREATGKLWDFALFCNSYCIVFNDTSHAQSHNYDITLMSSPTS